MADTAARPLSLPQIGAEPRRRKDRETEEQRQRRLARLAVQLAERERRARQEIAAATGSLPRNRHGSITPLSQIEDPERRLEVLKARVERLEAVLSKLNRKRETRAKIVMGAALYAEARDLGDADLLDRFRDILDRRVERPQDRLAILEAFGIDLQPVREEAGQGAEPPALPDFDTLIPKSARSTTVRGGRVHPDYKGLRITKDNVSDRSPDAVGPPSGDRSQE
ncbi:hypothetical protein [Caulobacter sp. S45]|uniref:hypothetical protein n=1 Tax=Caulobacter sp. S45 TaxID=1641861 RepID=UPI00131E4931|nr:hypothetical protein [Caulobacter sp. S45]